MALEDVGNILKIDYKMPMRNELNDGVVVSAQLERNTDSIVGLYAQIAMEVGRETGVGARKELETFPRAGSVEPAIAFVKVKRAYGVYSVSRAEIEAMATDKGAYDRAIPRRMRNLKNAITRNKSREEWGDGSGRIAQCATNAAPTNDIILDADTAEQVLVNLAEGMQVDIGTNANPQLKAADRRVVSVDFDTVTVTVSGPAFTTATTDYFFRQGSGGVPGGDDQREMTGLLRGVDDTLVLQGLDPADAFVWAATVDDAGGTPRPINDNLLERVLNKAENRCGRQVDALFAEDGVYRAMVNSLRGRQREVNRLELHGGHSAIDYTFGAESIALAKDRDAPAGSLFGFVWDSMAEFIQADWQWEDEMGGNVLRLSPDRTHVYEAVYFTFRELGWYERNPNVRIDDLISA